MSQLKDRAARMVKSAKSFELLAVSAFFFLATCFLTNWVILELNSKIFTAGIGDGTSGFLWLVFADQGLGYMDDHTKLVNYPFGESLWSPVYITWTLVLGPLWLLSRIVSPIAAMNILMIFAFVSCGVLAYYFIKSITKNRAIALLGGYAITFVSYHIVKGVDHFTNIFAWVFIAIIWTFLLFWRKSSWKHGILLALSIAAACYTDGYYILLTGVLLSGLFFGALVFDLLSRQSWRDFGRKIGRLIIVGGFALIALAPMLYVQFTAGGQISTDLSNARGNMMQEIAYYSSKPIDFLLPVDGNVTASQLPGYDELREVKNSRSNPGENATYIGYVVFGLYLIGVYFCFKAVSRIRHGESATYLSYTHIASTVAVPLVFVWMLPPTFEQFGLTIYSPTWLLGEHVPYWRVPSRVFLVLHPLMVTAACITLYYLIRQRSKKAQYVIVGALLVVVALEYFTLMKRPSFGVDNMPTTYRWLANQDSITSVAELPLVDRPIEIAGYAVFAQIIHGKPLVNSAMSKTTPGMFNPLADHTNPETINFLRDRNVDAVVIHARSCQSYGWGELIHEERDVYSPPFIDEKADDICVYRLTDAATPDSLYINADKGFLTTNFLNEMGEYWVAIAGSEASLYVSSEEGSPTDQTGYANLEAEIGSIGEDATKDYAWRASQNGIEIARGSTDADGNLQIRVDVTQPIILRVMTVDGAIPGHAEVGLRNIQVTR